jgi:antitoxin MazE
MSGALRTRIVKIGNSQGIRIPKILLRQAGLGDEVEVVVEGSQLLLRPVRRPREGWDDRFKEMAARGDDAPLIETSSLTMWDETEWEW